MRILKKIDEIYFSSLRLIEDAVTDFKTVGFAQIRELVLECYYTLTKQEILDGAIIDVILEKMDSRLK